MIERSKIDEFIQETTDKWFYQEFDDIVNRNANLLKDFYMIGMPIYEVHYISDEEGRQTLLFSYCSGEKEDIINLIDHESSLMGSRKDMVNFFEVDLKQAVRRWIIELERLSRLVKEQEEFLSKNKYPRKEKDYYLGAVIYSKEHDEKMLKHWDDELKFLRETGPVYQIKPSNQVQRCPRCLKRIQNAEVIKEDQGKLWGEL